MEISDDKNKIVGDMIHKYIKAWDLKQKGLSDEQIADKIPVRKSERKEKLRSSGEMLEADQGIDNDTDYNLKRIKGYIEKAEMMIKQGFII
ncbi:MAG: hypothetical protein WAU47_10150 [Desulfobaccales bacterium]